MLDYDFNTHLPRELLHQLVTQDSRLLLNDREIHQGKNTMIEKNSKSLYYYCYVILIGYSLQISLYMAVYILFEISMGQIVNAWNESYFFSLKVMFGFSSKYIYF